MAAYEQPLNRIQAPTVIAQPVSIGPHPAEHRKDDARKDRRRRPGRDTIERTLEEEQELRKGAGPDTGSHIDYHA